LKSCATLPASCPDRLHLLRVIELLLELFPLSPGGRVPKFPLDRGNEPGQAPLDQEVVRARLQRRHRRLLANRAGDDDERDVVLHRLREMQGFGPTEGRQAVIGQHDVPPAACQGGPHRLRRFNALPCEIVAAAFHRVNQEFGVRRRVFDDQRAEWLRHGTLLPSRRTAAR